MSEHTPLTEAAWSKEAHDARLAKNHWTLDRWNVEKVIEHIEDYPEIVAAALAARTSTATADTGLRERVEALADEMGRDLCECEIHWSTRIRAILDATAAPTADTGARDD